MTTFYQLIYQLHNDTSGTKNWYGQDTCGLASGPHWTMTYFKNTQCQTINTTGTVEKLRSKILQDT